MKSILILLIFSILNFISWNFYGLVFILNIALIFYYLDTQSDKNIWVKCIMTFVLLLFFNLSSLFWLYTVDGYKCLLVFIANSILYTPVFLSYYMLKGKRGIILFIFIYTLADVLYANWDLAFPWLNFGHVLGNQYYLIKWYAVVGTLGGGIWLLFMGWLFYRVIYYKKRKTITLFSLGFILPISSIIYYKVDSYENSKDNYVNVLAYNPLKASTNYNKAKSLYLDLKEAPEADFIVTPELFFKGLHPNEFKNGVYANYFNFFFNKNPNSKFIIGTELFNTKDIRFNGIAVVSKSNSFFRTKKKYVPIREFIPSLFTSFYPSYYVKNKKDDEKDIIHSYKIFPLVCYESIFSFFVADKSNQTDVLFLLTSERFMNGSYFGKKQYLNIVRVRAIENNKSILKVADDGISCVILPNGRIEKRLDKEIEMIEMKIFKKQSIYSKIINSL